MFTKGNNKDAICYTLTHEAAHSWEAKKHPSALSALQAVNGKTNTECCVECGATREVSTPVYVRVCEMEVKIRI